MFEDQAAYDRYVRVMVAGAAIRDARSLWWMVRPSSHAPTLELRVSDCCTDVAVPFAAYLDAMVGDVAEDAEALGCVSEIERARAIVREGTSSDRQRALFEAARGADPMHTIVDWIAATTASA